MNTTKKIAVVLVVLMVAAAAAPAAMGVSYTATVTTNQNTALTNSDGAFGNVTAGTSYNKAMTIQLKNSGNANAKVTASGGNFTAGSDYFADQLKINGTTVTEAGAVVVTSLAPSTTPTDYAGDLSIPSLQAAGSYSATVDLVFADA